jgi:hypothetical protein
LIVIFSINHDSLFTGQLADERCTNQLVDCRLNPPQVEVVDDVPLFVNDEDEVVVDMQHEFLHHMSNNNKQIFQLKTMEMKK